jgi:hypothetical protein
VEDAPHELRGDSLRARTAARFVRLEPALFARCGLHAQPRRIVAAGVAGVACCGPQALAVGAAEFSCDLAISRAW